MPVSLAMTHSFLLLYFLPRGPELKHLWTTALNVTKRTKAPTWNHGKNVPQFQKMKLIMHIKHRVKLLSLWLTDAENPSSSVRKCGYSITEITGFWKTWSWLLLHELMCQCVHAFMHPAWGSNEVCELGGGGLGWSNSKPLLNSRLGSRLNKLFRVLNIWLRFVKQCLI